MSIKFKIFFQETLDKNEGENVVLIKGNLLNYKWSKLREKIIENSNNSYFQSKNLNLKSNDNFILNINEKPQLNDSQLSNVYNDITFSYLLEKLKEAQQFKTNIIIKFGLEKIENFPRLDIDIYYGACIKKVLNKCWKNEKEKIKNELNELVLINSEFNFLNNNLKMNENKKLLQIKNSKTICNNCLSIYFYGYRFMCSYCDNFSLCSKCYKEDIHNKEHNFILFKEPILDDINKYDNKISPCSQIFKNRKESFEVCFKMANTGEKDLIGCYIGYIKFDKNYLYCEKYEIKENFENNIIKDINLKIIFDDKFDINFNIFEGNFRMFTKQGIPFGKILKIKVINNYVSKID